MADTGRSVHPNALPNYLNAEIPSEKLVKYALNPTHLARDPAGSRGRDKARVFKSVLGFDQSNWELLSESIKAEVPYHEAVSKEEDEFGKRYAVILAVTGPTGVTADVLTGWIIEPGSDHPRLTTARVLIKGR